MIRTSGGSAQRWPSLLFFGWRSFAAWAQDDHPVDQHDATRRVGGRPHRTVRGAAGRAAGFTVQTPPRIALDLPGVTERPSASPPSR